MQHIFFVKAREFACKIKAFSVILRADKLTCGSLTLTSRKEGDIFSFKSRGISKSLKKLFNEMISEMSPIFKEEADVTSILHSVFTAMFDFAIRVYNGELEDNEINRPHIFNVLYCMMMTYFKDSEKAS